MLSRQNKEAKVSKMVASLAAAGGVVIAENQGLSVGEFNAIRKNLKAVGGSATVVKNTLATIAICEDKKFMSIADSLSGPLVYGVGEDAAALAKVFVDEAKNNPKLVIRGGVLPDAAPMDAEALQALAQLPSREVLLAQLAATLQSPIATFVRTLNEIPGGFVRAVDAVRVQKDAQ